MAWQGRQHSVWRWAAVAAAGFAVAVTIGAWRGSPTAHNLTLPSPIDVDPTTLDFGEVWEQPQFEWAMTVRNRTTAPVHVENLLSSCSCASISPRSFVLSPHGTQEVKVLINLFQGLPSEAARTRNGLPAALAIQDFSLTFAADLNDPTTSQVAWILHGRVRTYPIKASPAGLHWEEPLQRGKSPSPRVVELSSSIPLQDVRAEAFPRNALTVHLVDELSTDTTHFLSVTPRSTLPPGPFNFAVRVTPTTTKGEQLPFLVLPVSGEIESPVRIEPRRVVFAAAPVGERQEQTVTISARGEREFKITEITPSSSEMSFETDSIENQAASELTCTLRQRITHSGSRRETVVVTIEFTETGERESFTIEVFSLGTKPE